MIKTRVMACRCLRCVPTTKKRKELIFSICLGKKLWLQFGGVKSDKVLKLRMSCLRFAWKCYKKRASVPELLCRTETKCWFCQSVLSSHTTQMLQGLFLDCSSTDTIVFGVKKKSEGSGAISRKLHTAVTNMKKGQVNAQIGVLVFPYSWAIIEPTRAHLRHF